MSLVTLSLGSNIDPDTHIRLCLDALEATFGRVQISRIFESEPVGFKDSRNFYNLVVAFDSDWSVGELRRGLSSLRLIMAAPPTWLNTALVLWISTC